MPGAPSIDPVKAAAAMELGESLYTPTEIAKMTGINRHSVHDILARHGHWGEMAETPVFRKYRLEQKVLLQSATMLVAGKALKQVDDKIDKASAYQAAGIYGLLRTHERLDAGEPTEITASINLHAIQGLDRLAAMLSQSLLPASNDVPRETIEIKAEEKQEVKT